MVKKAPFWYDPVPAKPPEWLQKILEMVSPECPPEMNPPKKVFAVTFLCGEEHARALLELNTHNRPSKPAVLAKFASVQRRNGVFNRFIFLTEDGIDIDGQHRLLSIADTGIPAYITLVIGADLSEQDGFDINAKRNLRDRYKLKTGRDIHPIAEATLSAMFRFEGRTISKDIAEMEKHDQQIHEVLSWFPLGEDERKDAKAKLGVEVHKKLTASLVIAPFVRAAYTYPNVVLKKAIDLLVYGGEESSSLKLLRSRIITAKHGMGGQTARNQTYGWTERALIAYLVECGIELPRPLKKYERPLKGHWAGATTELFDMPAA